MGRIKSTLIKRTANRLVELYRPQFNEDYQHNKLKVNEYTELHSIKLRNTIAGLVTKLVRKKQ